MVRESISIAPDEIGEAMPPAPSVPTLYGRLIGIWPVVAVLVVVVGLRDLSSVMTGLLSSQLLLSFGTDDDYKMERRRRKRSRLQHYCWRQRWCC